MKLKHLHLLTLVSKEQMIGKSANWLLIIQSNNIGNDINDFTTNFRRGRLDKKHLWLYLGPTLRYLPFTPFPRNASRFFITDFPDWCSVVPQNLGRLAINDADVLTTLHIHQFSRPSKMRKGTSFPTKPNWRRFFLVVGAVCNKQIQDIYEINRTHKNNE